MMQTLRDVGRSLPLMLALLAPAGAAMGATPCSGDSPCEVADGRYYAAAPQGWDGRAKLPLLMFLHGWQGSGADIMTNADLVAAVNGAGALLIAPDGRDRTWSHVGSPSQARDDVAFLRAVLADARARWPVDPAMVVASGFSQGGSMVWDLACYAADAFTAFLPLSGGFWEPLPSACRSGPVNLRHIHGRADDVVPMTGRMILGRFRQGDIMRGMTVWRAEDGCAAAPEHDATAGFDCETWTHCASGCVLQLCTHPEGHMFEPTWIVEGLAWARSLSR